MDVDNRIPIDFVVNGEHDMLNRHCQFSDWIDFSVFSRAHNRFEANSVCLTKNV